MALKITVYRSKCTGPTHGWTALTLDRIGVQMHAVPSGTDVGLHVWHAADARALAAALIEAADATDAHLAAKETA